MSRGKNEKTNILKNLIKITRYLYSVDKKYISILLASSIFNGLIPVIRLVLMQKIINTIQLGIEAISNILGLVIIYVISNFLYNIYTTVVQYYYSKVSLKLKLNLTEKILIKSSKLSLTDYENSETFDTINRAQKEGGDHLISYVLKFTNIFATGISIFSYLILLIEFNYKLVFIILIIPVIKFWLNKKINIRYFNIIKNRTNDLRKAWYVTHMITYGNFYKELKTYNTFDYFINQYSSYVSKFNEEDLKVHKKLAIINIISNIFENIIDGIILISLAIQGFIGTILIGDVITYINIIDSSKNGIALILMSMSTIIRDSLFIDQLFIFFNIKEENNENKTKIDKLESIQFKNVNYKYPNSSKYVLKNINLTIDKNKKIAILGRNGSGKTTLIKLIMGFYGDYEGEILVNGIDLKAIDKTTLLARLSTLFQDFSKYEATLQENIAFGNLSLLNKENDILKIAKKFKLENLISTLRNGISTQLGTWFDGGVNLSMGQWQKIALSRSFAKNGDLYILDEPNAALDLIAEDEISNLYKNVLKDKMGIIIVHKFNRFSTYLDEIIVLEDGCIVEHGTHVELLNLGGLYSELYNLS